MEEGRGPVTVTLLVSKVGVETWALKAHMIITSSGFASPNRLKRRRRGSLTVGDQLSPFV